jgi:hypothetical protein
LRFFEESGYYFLIICENGISIFSPVPEHPSNFAMNPLWVSWIILCGMPTHSAGEFSRCRLSEPLGTKKFSVVTEVDPEWVPLRGFTVTLELVPCVQSSVGADSTLDVFHRPTGSVGLRSREQCFVPCLEALRDLKELVLLCLFVLLLDYFSTLPSALNQPFVRIFFRPPLRESRSQQK